ncbi:MutS-related protein, family 1 [hydrothermal vent metagenome]|uniref:MutS-related protein, family 1 n=1 Tax=hydrothermal vent metagenome TaxID=652676 RepID=A0A3B0UQ21_9ZZZZ
MTKKEKHLQRLQHQLTRLERRLLVLQQRSDQFSRWRLILFVLAGLVSGGSFLQWGPIVWLWVTAVSFIPFTITIILHRRVENSIIRFDIWQQIKKTNIARMILAWDDLPAERPFPIPLDHPFATDIDIVGTFSLHRLLDTAVSHDGSQRLHGWLLSTNYQPEAIVQRQERVRELAGQTHFRQRLTLEATLATDQSGEQWAGQELVDWLKEGGSEKPLRPLLISLTLLAMLNWLLFVGYQLWQWPPLWIGSIVVYAVLFITLGFPHTASLFANVMFLTDRLRLLNGVFSFLERRHYRKMPMVQQLCQPFLTAGERPSAHIKKIQRVVTGVGLRENWLLGFLLNALLPWDIYFAYRLGQCRADLSDKLPHWLDIWFELEATSSLATFATLNLGEWVWPTFEAANCPKFSATALGHPLILSDQRVCNDVRLDKNQAIYLITGSNMAGKSSFLRAVGVNLVLAYAGGPAVAQAFTVSWLRLFATIRIADSLNDGFSFFYAEVRRLSQLLTALNEEGERPLLFLIDEIFRGTNNRERLIGSRAYIHALAQGNGLGAIATHDLELVQLAEAAPKIQNVHFRDEVLNGRMIFDYRLHPGPCPTTNALKIMQLAGLPIDNTTF